MGKRRPFSSGRDVGCRSPRCRALSACQTSAPHRTLPSHRLGGQPNAVAGLPSPMLAALFAATKMGSRCHVLRSDGYGSRPNLSAPRPTRLRVFTRPATRDGRPDYWGGPLLTENSSEIDVDLESTKPERVTPTPVLPVLPVWVPLAEALVGRRWSMTLLQAGLSAPALSSSDAAHLA